MVNINKTAMVLPDIHPTKSNMQHVASIEGHSKPTVTASHRSTAPFSPHYKKEDVAHS